MSTFSVNSQIAIIQPKFEADVPEKKNGFAFNASRINLVAAEVAMAYESPTLKLVPGDKILLRGDLAMVAPWSRQVLKYGKLEFVLCPEISVIGVELQEPPEPELIEEVK